MAKTKVRDYIREKKQQHWTITSTKSPINEEESETIKPQEEEALFINLDQMNKYDNHVLGTKDTFEWPKDADNGLSYSKMKDVLS